MAFTGHPGRRRRVRIGVAFVVLIVLGSIVGGALAASSSLSSATSGATVTDHFLISAATTTPTAGAPDNLTITAQDNTNATDTTYTGDHSLTFSGAGTIGSINPTVTDKTGAPVNFGSATTIAFTNGVATVSAGANGAMTLVKAEGPITINATDGTTSTTSGAGTPTPLSVTVSPGSADHLLLQAATTTPAAGAHDDLTVTAQDNLGNTASSYTGDKSLTFSGAGSVGANHPTVTDKTGAAVNFGVATTITFTNGVAAASAGANGTMTLVKVEGPITIDATDGTTSTTSGAGTPTPLSVTVSLGGADHLLLQAATTTPAAGAADNLTITAQDAANNTVTSYTGDHSLTFSGAGTIGSSNPTVTDKTGADVNFGASTSITFTNGVATVSAGANGAMTLVKAEGPITVNATDGSVGTTTGAGTPTPLSVTVSPSTADHLLLQAADTTPTTGAADNLTITAQDFFDNTAAGYTGDKSLTFTGAGTAGSSHPTVTDKTGAAKNFGTATTITFASGQASVSAGANGVMKLVKAEGPITINATDGSVGTLTGAGTPTPLSVTVTAATVDHLVLAAATTTPTAGVNDALTITAEDASDNTVTTYTGDKSLTFSGAGTIGGNNPTVTNKGGTATNFGSATTITFTNGVATVNANKNGQMNLAKAEGPITIDVTDGTHGTTSGAGSETPLVVTVSAGTASQVSLTGSTADLSSTTTRTFTATIQDDNGNTVTTSSDAISFAQSAGTGSVSFGTPSSTTNGVATAVATGVLAGTVTIKAHDASLTPPPGGTDSNTLAFDVVAGPASAIALTGTVTNLASGSSRTFTAALQDGNGNPVTSGPDATDAITFGKVSGTGTLTFASPSSTTGGVATDQVTGVLVGSVTIKANAVLSGPGSTDSNPLTFTVINGPAQQIALTGSVTDLASGTARTFTATIQDAAGNTVTTTSDANAGVTFSKTGGSGTLSFATPSSTVNGVATDQVTGVLAGSVTIKATASLAGAGGSVNSNPLTFNVAFGTATQIVLSGGVTDLASGSGRTFTATIEDAAGNPVTSGSDSTDAMTFSKTAGTGTLNFAAPSSTVGGVATDVVTGVLAGSVTIKANATVNGSSTVSNGLTFDVVAGPAVKLAFKSQPSGTIHAAGTDTFTTQVAVEDTAGNTVTTDNSSSVTLSMNGAGTLACTNGGGLTMTASSGLLDFTGCSITLVGTHFLLATDNSSTPPHPYTQAVGTTFSVIAGNPSQLAFTAQPTTAKAGVSISPAVQVTVEDQNGNPALTDTSTVTVSIKAGTGGSNPGVLAGALSASAGPGTGIASFANLSISKTGTNYQLHATDGSLTAADSSTPGFNITTRISSSTVSCSPSSQNAGASATCTATVADTDPGIATAPLGTVTLNTDGSGGFSNPGATCTLAQIGVTASSKCQVTYTPSSGTGAGSTHTIGAGYTPNDSVHATSTATGAAAFPLAITTSAGLSVSVSGNSPVAGGAAVFTITVTNNGPSDAQSVSVNDTPPAILTGVTGSVNGGGAGAWGGSASLGTIGPGGSGTVVLSGTVPASTVTGTTITNTASASSPTDGGSPRTASGTATVQPPTTPVITPTPTPTPTTAPVVDAPPPAAAFIPPVQAKLSVAVSGSGKVTSKGIACGGTLTRCQGKFAPGTKVTLVPSASAGFHFTGWSSNCTGDTTACSLTVKKDTTVKATFAPLNVSSVVPVTIGDASFDVKWSQSNGTGKLKVSGTIGAAADVTVNLNRVGGRKPAASKQMSLGGGKFGFTLPLPPGPLADGKPLVPGGYVVSMGGKSRRLPVPTEIHTLTLGGPPEGVVGTSIASVHGKSASVHFVFASQPPDKNVPVSVLWFQPNGKLLGTAPKSNRPTVDSSISSNAPLPKGTWKVELKVGSTITKITTFKVP
jgi:hypothetical protein